MESKDERKTDIGGPLLSVVTPVYNAEAFLPVLYGCLRAQTRPDWEWVVVDDGSTDGSGALLRGWAERDARVSYHTCPHSGSAKYPRDMAVSLARAPHVVCIDADDRVADDYLEKMYARMRETGADIVYPVMRFLRPDGTCTDELPATGFDRTKVYRGRDLVGDTILIWRIGCNGGLYDKAVWTNLSYPRKKNPVWMNSDEVDERIYLTGAGRVAFADTVYSYINHDASITRKFSPKLFHRLKTDRVLLDLVRREFGTAGREYVLTNRQMFCTWRYCLARFVSHFRELYTCRDFIYGDLRENLRLTDASCLAARDRRKFLGLRHFRLLFVLACLRHAPGCLLHKLAIRFFPRLYAFLLFRPKAERELAARIAATYSCNGGTPPPPHVVSVCNGAASHGGLVDRLRGAVSVYQLCREQGRTFKLHFVHPFPLTDYLEPNDYDWRAGDGDLSFDRGYTRTIVLETATGTTWEKDFQRRLLRRKLKASKGQTHVYTNAACCYGHGFGETFRELFRPKAALREKLDGIRERLGGKYISVSARFLNLMGDFNEENYSEPLPPAAQEALLRECLTRLERLRPQHPECHILVCSDSVRFLERAARIPRTYVIPGSVSHIDNDVPHDYAYYEKTFLDFYAISRAERVYLLKESRMMNSGFPYAAAQVGGKPYEVIRF